MEGESHAIECRFAQMNVFSQYCLTFSANGCVFTLSIVHLFGFFFVLQGRLSTRLALRRSCFALLQVSEKLAQELHALS